MKKEWTTSTAKLIHVTITHARVDKSAQGSQLCRKLQEKRLPVFTGINRNIYFFVPMTDFRATPSGQHRDE